VVVERDAAARLLATGAGLADVVQQRSQPQHQVGSVVLQRDGPLEHAQGVLVDVLVLVVLVDLQAQRRQLGQHVLGQPGVDSSSRPAAGVRPAHQLGQLVLHALHADDRQPCRASRHGGDHAVVDPEAELAGEPGGAQHPQRVVAEGFLRAAGGAQHALGQVLEPAVRVDEGVLGAFQSGSATAMALTAKSRRTRSSASESP
jgi:hypothetical protein